MPVTTRNNGEYLKGFYKNSNAFKTNSSAIQKATANLTPSGFKSFIKDFEELIIDKLDKKKREPLLMKNKIQIKPSIFFYLADNGINGKFQNNFDFLLNNNILFKRYFSDHSFNQICENTFKLRVSKKKRKQYLVKENNLLIEKSIKQKYFFHFKFMKERILP